MRKASVTPLRNRNTADGNPPRKSDRMKVLDFRRSSRSREWYVCPCSMITAPKPRSQSKNCSRDVVFDLGMRYKVRTAFGERPSWRLFGPLILDPHRRAE